MAKHPERDQHAEEVLRRNIEQSRELLAKKHQAHDAQHGEPPLAEDKLHADESPYSHEANTVHDTSGSSGIRNMAGGRPKR